MKNVIILLFFFLTIFSCSKDQNLPNSGLFEGSFTYIDSSVIPAEASYLFVDDNKIFFTIYEQDYQLDTNFISQFTSNIITPENFAVELDTNVILEGKIDRKQLNLFFKVNSQLESVFTGLRK